VRILVTNADDFGWSAGVNRGIIEAHEKGLLTSATLVATMPGAEEAAELARHHPTLDVGVHLVASIGCPRGDRGKVGPLVDAMGGLALGPGRVFFGPLGRRLRLALQAEFEAQVRWIADRGVRPTHADTHKHLHLRPAAAKLVAEVIRGFGIERLRSFRPLPLGLGRSGARMTAAMGLMRLWGERGARLAGESGMVTTDYLLGVAETGAMDVEGWRRLVETEWSGTAELMLHPGYAGDLDASQTRLVAERDVERKALQSAEVRRAVQTAGIRLVRWSDVERGSR
jgi:predicted glycoside hydrolase/deacetylase ChbG (UPF0249 family)